MVSHTLAFLLAAAPLHRADANSAVATSADEPEVPIVSPGPAPVNPAAPPSDAIVLFDGTSLEGWTHLDGQPARWIPDGHAGGAMTCKPGSGSIITRQVFGDAQIHVEFATPSVVDGEGQGRGNSGVYIQNRYEVQVLDSFENKTYPMGQCGAIYLQSAPLVNACRRPGEWQTYDIVFRAPRFDGSGNVTTPGRITVLHNGILIQDHVPITAPTGGGDRGTGDGPIHLQDHGNTVKFRNIWVRPL